MEVSFGNQKLHYGMGWILARNRRSEILQIFFGIHMANAAIMAPRQLTKERGTEGNVNRHEESLGLTYSGASRAVRHATMGNGASKMEGWKGTRVEYLDEGSQIYSSVGVSG